MAKMHIVLDERIWAVSAVLAASDWPEIEQSKRPHAVHPHSKHAMQYFEPHRTHAAVQYVNRVLAEGWSLDRLLDVIVCCSYPGYVLHEELPELDGAPAWLETLPDFAQVSKIESFFTTHRAVWEGAAAECRTIFADCPLPRLVEQLTGRARTVRLMPSLIFPMLDPAVANIDNNTTILLPPPKAWGESPPWPFKEDPIWSVVEAAKAVITDAVAPFIVPLGAEQQRTLIQAAVALCLGQHFDDFEQQAYVVRIKKEEKLADLPHVTNRLHDWLAAGDETPVTAVFEQ